MFKSSCKILYLMMIAYDNYSMKHNYILLYIFTTSLIIWSQNISEPISIPFVTDIQIYSSGISILLQWTPPENNTLNYEVYRSSSMIETLNQATKIATLKKSESSYTDTPPFGNYYYAIVLSDLKLKKTNEILIPYRNTLPYPVSIEKEKEFRITSLSVSVDSKINIRWTYTKEGDTDQFIHIYRNIVQINSADILKKSIKIARVNILDKNYNDKTIPGINYFYATVEESKNTFPLIKGVNFTENSVVLTGNSNYIKSNDFSQFAALPLLSFNQNPHNGDFFENEQILQFPFIKNKNTKLNAMVNITCQNYKEIVENIRQSQFKNEQIIPIEKLPDEDIFIPDSYAEEYKTGISQIENNEWNNAINTFYSIISATISKDTFYRISYYLGLSYYQKGEFYNSFIYILQSHYKFPAETKTIYNALTYSIYNSLEK